MTVLKIGYLDAATTLSTHRVIVSCDKAQIGLAKVVLAPISSFIAASNDAKIGNLTMTALSGNGGIAVNGCQRCEINGGTITGDRLFSFAINCVARNLTATLVTGALVSDTNSHFLNSTVNSVFYGDSFYREDTAANIASVASAINTVGKYEGKQVWDVTSARMMRATGSTAASTWQSIGGGTTVTPA